MAKVINLDFIEALDYIMVTFMRLNSHTHYDKAEAEALAKALTMVIIDSNWKLVPVNHNNQFWVADRRS
jgi:hypothetical protein